MIELLSGWKEAAPATGAITAIVSAIVAFFAFRYTRAANRRRATLDMVMKTLLDDTVQDSFTKFRELIRKNDDTTDCFKLASLGLPEAKGTPDRRTMLRALNIYELMALGIKRKIFDEAFYKRWHHNQFMMDIEGCRDFIEELQKTKSTLFCEASLLYSKWEKNGHPESSPNRLKMAWWGLVRNHARIDQAREVAKAR
jgi:hypothetical protein